MITRCSRSCFLNHIAENAVSRVVRHREFRRLTPSCGSEAWGPSGTALHEIAAATTDEQQRSLILQTLWDRLRCPDPPSQITGPARV